MALVKVGSVSALWPGRVMEARVGESVYALCNQDGDIHALEGSCPCTGGPLGRGALREQLLVCPWHGWKFDCATGRTTHNDKGVATFPVTIEGDDILIDIRDEFGTAKAVPSTASRAYGGHLFRGAGIVIPDV